MNEDERTYLQGVLGIADFPLPMRSLHAQALTYVYLGCLKRSTPNAAILSAFTDRLAELSPNMYNPYHKSSLVSTSWHAYDGTPPPAFVWSKLELTVDCLCFVRNNSRTRLCVGSA